MWCSVSPGGAGPDGSLERLLPPRPRPPVSTQHRQLLLLHLLLLPLPLPTLRSAVSNLAEPLVSVKLSAVNLLKLLSFIFRHIDIYMGSTSPRKSLSETFLYVRKKK